MGPRYDSTLIEDVKAGNLRRMKKGVKGMFPLGCLPLWGREGVILIKRGGY